MNQFGPVTWIAQARAKNANAACLRGGAATQRRPSVNTNNTPNGRASSSIYTQRHLDAISAETVMVTPEMATTLRSDCHFERQRPISENNVARLALEMQRGWFIPGTPIYLCVLPNGQMQIANGNHTLEAIKSSGVSVPLVFVYAKVSDIEAVARVYANMDLQKMRTWRNALQALSGEATVFDGRLLAAVGVIGSGFATSNSLLKPGSTSRTERFALLEEYRDAGSLFLAAAHGAPKANYRLLQRAAVLAVVLLTFRYQPSAASEFWSSIAKDDGLKVGDPRKTLLRYLTNNSTSKANNRAEQAKAAALAWNAAWGNKQIEYVKPNSAGDIRILGTSWHSGDPAKARPSRALKFETGVVTTPAGSVQQVARFAG